MTTAAYSWIDSHCHPHFPQLGGDFAAVLSRMRENGVSAALAVATGGGEWARVRRMARENPGVIYAACGVHPLSGADEADDESSLIRVCEDAAVLAAGETGLDFFRGKDSEIRQRRRFAAHIAAARRLKKPLIIHARDSTAEILDMLRAENARDAGGVMHCFTGGKAEMRAALDLNFVVSFSGILTFKKSDALRAVAAAAPADGYMVETDAPYLSPAPHRGKTNTPGYARFVGEAVAAARGISAARAAAESTATFIRLFKPPEPPAAAR
ncbi:MAG: TatD family hydrolase [Gammaproteobacteria bacterium]